MHHGMRPQQGLTASLGNGPLHQRNQQVVYHLLSVAPASLELHWEWGSERLCGSQAQLSHLLANSRTDQWNRMGLLWPGRRDLKQNVAQMLYLRQVTEPVVKGQSRDGSSAGQLAEK